MRISYLKKYHWAIIMLLTLYGCNIGNKNSTQIEHIGTGQRAFWSDGLEYKYTLKDIGKCGQIQDEVLLPILEKYEFILDIPCHWEAMATFSRKMDSILLLSEDMAHLNFFLKKNLRIKDKIDFQTVQGREMADMIINSQFEDGKMFKINATTRNWDELVKGYEAINFDSIYMASSDLRGEKNKYLVKYEQPSESDICSVLENLRTLKYIERAKEDKSRLFVCATFLIKSFKKGFLIKT